MLLVLARNLSRKIGALEIFDDAIEVVEQMLMVLLALTFGIEQKRLDSNVAQEEAEAHVQLLCLEVDILLPDCPCFHVTTNALNGAFKYLLNLFVGIGPQVMVLFLEEREVIVPQVYLTGVVAKGALVDFLGLSDSLHLVNLWVALYA